MKRLSAAQSIALAIPLLLAGVFAGAKAYSPAESWTTPEAPRNKYFTPEPQRKSRGASVDPTLATISAGCLVAAGVIDGSRERTPGAAS